MASEKFSHTMTPAMQKAADNGAMGLGVIIPEGHGAGGPKEQYINEAARKKHERTESTSESGYEYERPSK